jgi:hypothetical protein
MPQEQMQQEQTAMPAEQPINLDNEADKLGDTSNIMQTDTAQNPVVHNEGKIDYNANFSDYNAYRRDLLHNISEFYNKDLTQNYKPYDISDLDRQRKQNINAATGNDDMPAPVGDNK